MTKPSLGPDAPLDVDRLVESRLLVQANSGAGKSWALRRLLEQSYAHVPQIVIDVEGEFHTLREKFDYVLAGQKGGDCPADTKSAALLARRLLELNVSAIVDIYELGVQRTRFVRLFLDALVNAPRELWHPTLVVIDEAHMFCPEAGQAESADAVKDLMTRGRKRGFCGVLATPVPCRGWQGFWTLQPEIEIAVRTQLPCDVGGSHVTVGRDIQCSKCLAYIGGAGP